MSEHASSAQFKLKFLSPRHWPAWLGIGLLRIIVNLPHPWRLNVGRMLGRLFYRIARSRRATAEVNISICFPELSRSEQTNLVKAHFESLGMAVIETAIGWWDSPKRLSRLTKIRGLHYIEDALEAGEGVILLSAHFTALEVGNRLLNAALPTQISAMYQQHKYEIMEYLIRRYRDPHTGTLIPEDDIRQLIKVLKAGALVWYASDQAYKDKHSALIPFFGEPSNTNTALPRLAKISRARVIPYFVRRCTDGTYRLDIQAPLENYPSGDDIADVLRYHALIEAAVREAPEQYLWVHRRFKRRPAEFADVYAKKKGG